MANLSWDWLSSLRFYTILTNLGLISKLMISDKKKSYLISRVSFGAPEIYYTQTGHNEFKFIEI
jgi:hypothetical protein